LTRQYAILDVFTDTPLEGNPLAVVLDAGGLSDDSMQKIAAEFNLSETVFVFPPEREPHAASIRIFTPREELPFAGHPTVGTAILLATERGNPGSADSLLLLEEKIGSIRCVVELKGKGGQVWFDAPKLPTPLARIPDKSVVAATLGLQTEQIGFENHIISAFGAGNDFTFIPVKNMAAIAEVRPMTDRWTEAFGGEPAYVYTRETVAVARQFHARMFAPDLGVPEDPATGSAAPAFAGAINRFDAPVAGTHNLIIEQGFEMNRPSLIALEIDVEGGQLTEIRIGGSAVIVARGNLDA
jgi:trans-2,3-dihydro-3-hydroxyanthranilate isomerase